MSILVDTMKAKKNYHGLNGATDEQIASAQKALGVSFSSDYKDYISSVGVATFDGHELTGLCSSARLNVVSVTEKCRQMHRDLKLTWYVLEELNIDQITIWQDVDGSIYQVSPNLEPVKIARDIMDYITL